MIKDILSPLTMVMEAKKSKTTDIKVDPKDDKETNDYSNDDEDTKKDEDKENVDKEGDDKDENIDTGNDYSVEDDEIGDDEDIEDPESTGSGDTDYGPDGLDNVGDGDNPDGGDNLDNPDSDPENGGPTEGDPTGNDYGNPEEGSGNEEEGGGLDQESPEDDSEKLKSLFLYKDFRKLQSFILNNIDKIRKTDRTSFLVKEVDNQVISNFEKLYDLINNYMMFKFKNNKYVVNLLNYNNFMMLIKINIQMLKKISNSKSNA